MSATTTATTLKYNKTTSDSPKLTSNMITNNVDLFNSPDIYTPVHYLDVVVGRIGHETVSRRSLITLKPGEWLNDEIIIFSHPSK